MTTKQNGAQSARQKLVADILEALKRRGVRRNIGATMKTLENFDNLREAHIHLDLYQEIWIGAIPGESKKCLMSLTVYLKFIETKISAVKTQNGTLRFQLNGFWYTFALNPKWFALTALFDQKKPWPWEPDHVERVQLTLLNKTPVSNSASQSRRKRKDAGKPRGRSYGKPGSRWAKQRVRGMMQPDLSYIKDLLNGAGHANR